MKAKMKLGLAALWMVLGLAMQHTATAQTTPGISSDNKILIGASLALSGPVAYAGRATVESMRMYFDYVNKEQGGVNGRQIRFIPEDDGYDVAKTVSAVRKLVTVDKVMAIAPIVGTAHVLAVREYLNTQKVAAFNGMAADPFIGNWPYLFGLGTPMEIQAAIGLEFIANDLGAKKSGDAIYAVVPDDAFGNSALKGLEPAAKALGVKLIVEKVPKNADQYGSVVTNIKRSGAKYLIAHPPRASTAALLREAEAQGLDVTVMSPTGTTTEAAIFDLAGKRYADHYYGVDSVAQWDEESDPLIKWARERFRAEGKADVLKEKNFFYVWGLIVAKTVVEAAKRAGPDITREKFAEALRGMDKYDMGGGVEPVTYKGQSLLIPGRTARISKGVITNGVVSLKPITPLRSAQTAINLGQ